MLPGFIPAIVATFYHDDPLPIWNLAVVAAAVAVLLWLAIRKSGDCRRMDRESWARTCLTYAVPPMIVLCLFPANLEYAFVVLTVLAFGDSAAAIGGRRFGKRKLPWNREKTWAGFLCFLALASPIAILVFWGEARPRVTLGSAVVCGLIPAALGAFAETLRSRIDDNLRVCIAAAIGVVITGELFVQLA